METAIRACSMNTVAVSSTFAAVIAGVLPAQQAQPDRPVLPVLQVLPVFP